MSSNVGNLASRVDTRRRLKPRRQPSQTTSFWSFRDGSKWRRISSFYYFTGVSLSVVAATAAAVVAGLGYAVAAATVAAVVFVATSLRRSCSSETSGRSIARREDTADD